MFSCQNAGHLISGDSVIPFDNILNPSGIFLSSLGWIARKNYVCFFVAMLIGITYISDKVKKTKNVVFFYMSIRFHLRKLKFNKNPLKY